MIAGGAVLLAATIAWLKTRPSMPKRAKAVSDFKPKKYLGKWYEIARLNYRFEKNLNNVTADYSLNEDGSIKVLNKGYDYLNHQWRSTTGKAVFRGDRSSGKLKVSFFGPFYSGYNVIALDPEYRYALVAGNDLSYLWILSREKSIPTNVKNEYLKIAGAVGYDTTKLIWTEHSRD